MKSYKTLINAINAYGASAEEIQMISGHYYDGEERGYIYTALRIEWDAISDYESITRMLRGYKYTIVSSNIHAHTMYIVKTSKTEAIADAQNIAKTFHNAFERVYHETRDGKKATTAGIAAVEKYKTHIA